MTIKLTDKQVKLILVGLSYSLDLENLPKSDPGNQQIIRLAKSIEKQTGISSTMFSDL